jgi:hypothetical protein
VIAKKERELHFSISVSTTEAVSPNGILEVTLRSVRPAIHEPQRLFVNHWLQFASSFL